MTDEPTTPPGSRDEARTFFIVNPRAGQGALERRWPAWALEHLIHTWAWTRKRGDAERLAIEAARSGYGAIVACGGDGTVCEAINGLMTLPPEARPALGILPFGTGNDLARSLDIPRDWEDADRIIARGHTRTIDLGTVDGECGTRYFGVATFLGGPAVMADLANTAGKQLHGLAGYLPHLGQGLRFRAEVTVRSDGGHWSGPVLCVEVANTPNGAGGVPVNPHARIDDGLLDVLVVESVPLPKALALLALTPQGDHIRLPFVHHWTATDVLLEGEGVRLSVDGDDGGPLPARIGIASGALRMFAPR